MKSSMCLCVTVLGVVLSLTGCSESKPKNKAKPKKLLRQFTGLVLPQATREAHFHEEALFVQWVFARFEIPKDELCKFFEKNKNILPEYSLLKKNRDLSERLNVAAKELSWWRPEEIKDSPCAERVKRRKGKTSDWILSIAILVKELDKGWVRVYWQSSEEPTARDTNKP